MKLSNAISSGLLAMVNAIPVAMATDGNYESNMEQRRDQNMEQTKENKEMHMEKRQNRFEKHEEKKVQNKDMFQNRLKEKQNSGFRMKSGSGGRR